MKAIIFGASGQDGFYLTKLLEEKGLSVIGIARSKPESFVDLCRFDQVSRLIHDEQPDYAFHLAAISATTHDLLFENFQTIVVGSLNLLESIKMFSPNTRLFLSGSGLQFLNSGLPLNESSSLSSSSSYAMARIQSLYAARYYRSLGVKVYFGYFFNHDSPLRGPRHVSQMIALAVKRIKAGSNEKIQLGNYDVNKEWGFAGDIVSGIWTLVNQETIFESVIGTGEAYAIKDWLRICFDLINKNWEDYVELKHLFVPEYDTLVSDPRTIFSLGWRPKVSITDLAKMMVLND